MQAAWVPDVSIAEIRTTHDLIVGLAVGAAVPVY
jgi:hypothetical protein